MKKIKFMSVSALNMFETMPNKFYMYRLAENKLPREPQPLAAAAGTMFDIEVKRHLLIKGLLQNYKSHSSAISAIKNRFCYFPWPQPQNKVKTLDQLFFEALEEQNRVTEIFDIGERLKDAYIKSDLFKNSLFNDIEIKNIFPMKVKLKGEQLSVPIYTILDVSLLSKECGFCGREYYPMDLKVSGYSSGASPKPGYYCMYDEDGLPLNEDKWENPDNMAFYEIDETWATQGCTYGWSLGRPMFKPFPFEIHAMFLGKTKKDGTRTIRTVGYKGTITEEFQKTVALRFLKAWKIINTGKDAPWNPDPLLCEMDSYNENFWG